LRTDHRGCQMVYWHTKSPNSGILLIPWTRHIWYILLYFVVVWYIFFQFGNLDQEKIWQPCRPPRRN
jgi:hypothetical protein